MKSNQGIQIIKGIVIGLGALIIVLVIFWAGIMVGSREARFSYQWGANYHHLFGPPPGPLLGGGADFMNPNSAAGTIIKVSTSTLLIKGDDNTEKSVVISNGTLIRSLQNTLSPSDLKVDDQVVILGEPSSTGQIEAKFIRVFPQSL
ncbi:MAG: hypothetical protein WC526_03450 [Patescibacteria group bacterium]